ncbi:hypothetical protein [Nostoc sp. FACHB-133]|nr:hypothetical protein [Nostoc sp. FACHB-133]MBD2527819.1 hypothetical protein [Nostoc sp. FACHB-133]
MMYAIASLLMCFIAFGQEFIKFTNDKEILVETAWRWEWERVLEYASS